MSLPTDYQFDSFENFFLGLPNPSVSIIEKKTEPPVHVFASESRCPSNNPSPLSFCTFTGSEDDSDVSSPPSSQNSPPSLGHVSVDCPNPVPFIPSGILELTEESILQTSEAWETAAKAGAQVLYTQTTTSDDMCIANNSDSELYDSLSPASQSPPGLPLPEARSIKPNYAWLQFLYKAAKIPDRHNPATQELLLKLAEKLVCGDEKMGTPVWTPNALHTLAQQLIWMASRETTRDCERDTLAYFVGTLMYSFSRCGRYDATRLLQQALDRYVNRLFQGCWNTRVSRFSFSFVDILF
jgi:hypothetical protein